METILVDSLEAKTANVIINDAFLSKNSMLSRDQGVTGISMFTNDLFFIAANYFNDFDFNEIDWKGDIDERQIEISSIDNAVEQFKKTSLFGLIKEVSHELMKFDWRMPTANFDNSIQQDLQKKYKGTGGYREIWRDLLNKFEQSLNPQLRDYSRKIEELSNI